MHAQILRPNGSGALDVYNIKLGGAVGAEIHIDAGPEVVLAFGMHTDHAAKAALVSEGSDDEECRQVFGGKSQAVECEVGATPVKSDRPKSAIESKGRSRLCIGLAHVTIVARRIEPILECVAALAWLAPVCQGRGWLR